MDTSKENTIIKGIAVLLMTVAGVFLLFSLLSGMGTGMNMGARGGYMYMGSGLSLSILMLFVVKLLFVLFVIGLIGGVVVWGKSLFAEKDIESIKSSFTVKKAAIVKEVCSSCGKELNSEWKLCPFCGQERETKVNESEG